MAHAAVKQESDLSLEILGQAVRALAVEPGDIRSRLLTASHWLRDVDPSDLPAGIRDDLNWVIDMLMRRQPRVPVEGRLQASLATMPARTGIRLAERIVSIERRLRLHHREAGRLN